MRIEIQGSQRLFRVATPAALLLIVAAGLLSIAASPLEAGVRLRRDLLAIYDPAVDPEPSATQVHQFLEMPAEHLGYRIVYRSMTDALPPPSALGHVRAVVVWLKGASPPPVAFSSWLAALPEAGVRVLLVATAGSLPPPELAGRDLLPGLRYHGHMIDDTRLASIAEQDPVLRSTETVLQPPLAPFPAVSATGAAAAGALRVHLSVDHASGRQRKASVVAATGRFGGYIAANYAVLEDPVTGRGYWMVDPYRFIALALGHADPTPIPDVTTVSGRRAYLSHIDGDGWGNPTSVSPYAERNAIAAEVVQRELIEAYPELPVTVGIIAGDLDTRMGGTAETRRTARNILGLRQVEAGVHTYTHPYDWRFFSAYSRTAETARLANISTAAARKPARPRRGPLVDADTGSSPPRLYAQLPYDRTMEVEGAIRLLAEFLPVGKRVALYQWSGSTRPDEAMLRLVREAGVANLNGGDPRFDRQYPSQAYLSPLSRQVGRERQIYAPASNEFIYWGKPPSPSGFLLHDEMLTLTESPRRLKPFNLYYHSYAAEQADSLAIVRRLLDRARHEALAPITASRYAGMVDGFFGTEIEEDGELRWLIRNRGELETVRFDAAGPFNVDIARSSGVAGSRRRGDSIYVALDPAVATPVVALTTAPAPRAPSLVESRWRLSGVQTGDCRTTARATGFGAGEMSWMDLRPGRYDIQARGASGSWSGTTTVGGDGMLAITIPLDAIDPVDIEILCQAH